MEKAASLVAIFGASVLFGTEFVAVKRHTPGDGVFVQFLMCVGIFFVGFCTFLYCGYEQFFPLAMVGGVAWALSNTMSIPIINELGLGLWALLSSVTNCLMNFFVSTFGLLGENARPPEIMWLDVVGMVLVIIGGIMTSFVKNKEPAKTKPFFYVASTTSMHSLDQYIKDLIGSTGVGVTKQYGQNTTRRLLAIGFSFIQGLLSGFSMVPMLGIQDQIPEAPQTSLPYVFSHNCGVVFTSLAVFIIYCFLRSGEPMLNPHIVLPSILAGLMWGISFVLMAVATDFLSLAITGPLTAMVPGCVATLWSVFYFREVEEGHHTLLWSAIGVTAAGALCIGLSKLDF